jgi:hypothetical protein
MKSGNLNFLEPSGNLNFLEPSGNLNFLEPSGPLQAYNGTALPFYITFSIYKLITKTHGANTHRGMEKQLGELTSSLQAALQLEVR